MLRHLLIPVLLIMTACASDSGRSTPAPQVAPYGTWVSTLSASGVTAGALRFDRLVLDGDDLYWAEGRPLEGGRTVIVRRTPDGRVMDMTPPPFNVRSRVHEYGGAAYTVHRGTVFFSNDADQRLYRQVPGLPPEPLTPDGCLYADCVADAARGRLLCVREDHRGIRQKAEATGQTAAEPVAAIVEIALERPPARIPSERVLAQGAHFYSNPIPSPDGTHLAWLQWQHPNMPWDGTELWMAEVRTDGTPGTPARIAGGADESIYQPQWSPDDRLYFVSDRTGWWNLYRAGRASGAGGEKSYPPHPPAPPDIEPIHPMPAEFGRAQWTFGGSTYAFIAADRLVVTYTEGGRWKMALVETEPRKFEPLQMALEPIDQVRADQRAVYFIGGSPTEPPLVARMSLAAVEPEIVRRSASDRPDPAWISVPEAVTFRSGLPAEARQQGERAKADAAYEVHAFYYPPKNPEFTAPEGERPPLIVITHGGPTGATSDVLDARVQFWTSRGFAVLDVNYSGSTGYGRDYRDRLKGQWGILDVADAVNGARYLVETGRADANRLIIRGGSAGGYTTLAALTFHDVFEAGASYYGISDIEVLARETHKFESRYVDSLIGPYPAARDLYAARSPIHFTDRLSAALILFQGLEDKVVPPNQSEMMADAVRRKGLPVAYLGFPGEQHGFRRAETIVRSLEAELYFYGAVFGFTVADAVEPVHIDNLR